MDCSKQCELIEIDTVNYDLFFSEKRKTEIAAIGTPLPFQCISLINDLEANRFLTYIKKDNDFQLAIEKVSVENRNLF